MALQTNLTTSAAISSTMQTYYDKKLLINAKPNLVHQSFGQKVVLPKNAGKSITFRKWTPFPALTTPLIEGTVPDGQSLEMTNVPAAIDQYGGYVAVSDLLDLTALDPVINDSVELMGDQGGLTVDQIVRDVLAGGTNVQFADDKTQRLELGYVDENGKMGGVLTVDEIRKAVRTLKKNRAPQFVRGGKGYYVAIVGPETTYDLQSDPMWQDVSKYAGGEQIFEGEIGKLFGVVFVESSHAIIKQPSPLLQSAPAMRFESMTNGVCNVDCSIRADEVAKLINRTVTVGNHVSTITNCNTSEKRINLADTSLTIETPGVIYDGDAGLGGATISNTLVFGKNAYGVIDIEGGNLRTIIKPKGSAGTADPLDQISTVGWKVDGFAAKILQPLWMVRIEHAVTD